ncbi:oligosaccharide flippase family protein [Marinihelvus fidelis]|nr:polysaccharide biosynthesis C-terminal domain-containing protein [Marinihelvus fidelis]
MAFSGLLLAKIMPPEQYGIYGHALSIVGIASILGAFGTETFLFREVGAKGGRAIRFQLRQELVGFSVITVLAFALCSVSLANIMIQTVGERGVGALGGAAKLVVGGLILVFSIIAPFKGVAKGEQRFLLAQGPDGVLRPLLLVAMVVACWQSGIQVDADLAISLYLFAAVIALAVLCVGVLAGRGMSFQYPDPSTRNQWIFACASLLFVAAAMVLNRQVDVIMLGFLVDESSTGAYVLATRFADLVAITLTALGISHGARCAKWLKRGEITKLQIAIKTGTRVAFSLTIILVVIVWVASPYVLAWFGSSYLNGLDSLRVLIVAQLINTGFGLTGLLLIMSGAQAWYSKVLMFSATINIVLNLILVPKLGVLGAAVATLVVTLLWNIAAWVRIRRTIAVDSSVVGYCPA